MEAGKVSFLTLEETLQKGMFSSLCLEVHQSAVTLHQNKYVTVSDKYDRVIQWSSRPKQIKKKNKIPFADLWKM
jgi:hypothetical protein